MPTQYMLLRYYITCVVNRSVNLIRQSPNFQDYDPGKNRHFPRWIFMKTYPTNKVSKLIFILNNFLYSSNQNDWKQNQILKYIIFPRFEESGDKILNYTINNITTNHLRNKRIPILKNLYQVAFETQKMGSNLNLLKKGKVLPCRRTSKYAIKSGNND